MEPRPTAACGSHHPSHRSQVLKNRFLQLAPHLLPGRGHRQHGHGVHDDVIAVIKGCGAPLELQGLMLDALAEPVDASRLTESVPGSCDVVILGLEALVALCELM